MATRKGGGVWSWIRGKTYSNADKAKLVSKSDLKIINEIEWEVMNFQKEFNNYNKYYSAVSRDEPFNLIEERAETSNKNSDLKFWYKNIDNLLYAHKNMERSYARVVNYIRRLSRQNTLDLFPNISEGVRSIQRSMDLVNTEEMTDEKYNEILGWKQQINAKVKAMKNRGFTRSLGNAARRTFNQFRGNNSSLRKNRGTIRRTAANNYLNNTHRIAATRNNTPNLISFNTKNRKAAAPVSRRNTSNFGRANPSVDDLLGISTVPVTRKNASVDDLLGISDLK